MIRARLLFTLLLLTLHVLHGQADEGEWRVIDVTALPDQVNQSYTGPDYLVSPDSSSLTWIDADGINADNKICLMALPSNVRLCHAIPPTYSAPSLISWSPDSRYVLLLDGLGEFSNEIIFEVATGEFLLIEKDNILLSEMFWNPTSEAVSYLTYHYINDDTPSTALRRFSLTTGTDSAYDLTPIFGTPLIFSGLVVVSDTRFVMLLRNGAADTPPGLWLVDITVQTAEHLVSYNDLEISVRPDAIRAFDGGDLVWDGEGERLLVTTQSTAPQFKTMSVLSVDLATGDIVPLLRAGDALTDASGFQGGTITPDAAFFFYFGSAEEAGLTQKTIFALPLDSPDHAPIRVTGDHPIDCLPTTALITLEHMDGSQRRYLYEPHIFCPG